MKFRHAILAALVVLASGACSDDDDGGAQDPCILACDKISGCGYCIPCNGICMEAEDCVSSCQQKQLQERANCVLGASCDARELDGCTAGISCP